MELLLESFSVLEALYDFHQDYDKFCEEQVRIQHNYAKTNDLQVVEEGLNDILQFIVENFRKFIGKVRDLFHRGIMATNSLGMEYSKIISKYGEELKTMKFIESEIEGFRYSTLSVNPPNIGIVYQLIDEFNQHIAKFDQLTTEQIRAMHDDAMMDISIGRLRGKLIGDGGRIEADGLRSHIYQMYRSGASYPVKLNIDKEMVNNIVNGSTALLKEKKLVGAQKVDILGLLQRMEKFFSISLTNLYDDINKSYNVSTLTQKGYADHAYTIRETTLNNFSMYMTMRYQQIMEMSNVMSVLFTERLGAIKDQINQERQILGRVLRSNKYIGESLIPAALEEANSYPITPNCDWAPILENVGI